MLESDEIFDIGIFDVRMSPVNGITLLATARKQHPEMKIIMLTAYHSDEISQKARDLGAYDYVGKPFSANYILERVEAALTPADS